MQPKVSQEILDNVRVASLHAPDATSITNLWAVELNTVAGEFYQFTFPNQESAEEFFKGVKVVQPKPVPTAQLFTREQVKEIVDAAVIPVVVEEPPLGGLAGFWQAVRRNWKNVTLGISVASLLLSSVVTLKVALGPVKVPEIIITLPDGSVVPTSAAKVETMYKMPVTNGLPD